MSIATICPEGSKYPGDPKNRDIKLKFAPHVNPTYQDQSIRKNHVYQT